MGPHTVNKGEEYNNVSEEKSQPSLGNKSLLNVHSGSKQKEEENTIKTKTRIVLRNLSPLWAINYDRTPTQEINKSKKIQ